MSHQVTSKQVSVARLDPVRTPFDALYKDAITCTDPNVLGRSVARMAELADKIELALTTAPAHIGRYFTWGTTPAPKDVTVDAQDVHDDVVIKLSEVIQRADLFSTGSSSPGSLPGGTSNVPPPLPGSLNLGSAMPQKTAKDLATGFANASANCWANSLLSMIVFVPNFRVAYETVANYHAAKSVYDPTRAHGIALQEALTAYDTCLSLKTAVPSEVTQKVRLAFNHFFGYVDPISRRETFSQHAWTHEDSSEAMMKLMGEYERIKREQNHDNPDLSHLYCPLQTTRHYRPVGAQRDADSSRLARDDYSKLNADNASRLTNNDYQIFLDLQNKGHLSFSALLTDYFRNTSVDDHNEANYLLTNGKVQSFKLTAEGRRFIRAPDEFLLTIKRFGADMRGQGFKIMSPVMINRIISLPAEATSDNIPIAYELDSFIVHSGGSGGGHYICYKKIGDQWIEANDSSVRFVDTNEIDQILHGQRGAEFTSYMHHYTRVPQAAQALALAAAVNAQLPPTVVPLLAQADVEKYTKQKAARDAAVHALEFFSSSTLAETSVLELNRALELLPPDVLSTFRHAIWLHDKTPNVHEYGTAELTKSPHKIREIKLPWLIGPTGTALLDQMISYQKKKQQIAEERLLEAQGRAFLAKVDDSSIPNNELIEALNALPQKIQWELHGLIYHSHKIKFGEAHVNNSRFKNEYGKLALGEGDLRKTLTEASESVLNLFGRNIVEQIVSDHKIKAEKLEYAFEKEQLQAFRELLIHYPTHDISNQQLGKAFERLEIRPALKEKLYWSIWFGHNKPNAHNYGANAFHQNPRCVLAIRNPLIADEHICKDSDILTQMIALLNKASL